MSAPTAQPPATAPSELPKAYAAAEVEAAAYATWLAESCFAADPTAPGEPYCIVIPPPNVTGALHLGHALNNTLQDILIRRARMQGKNTLWVPGIDHAGIATQAVVEKQLKENENKTRHDVGREGLVQRIWDWKAQYGDRIIAQLKRMGCSCDWDRTRFTLDDMCARAVRETFFKMFRDGKVFRGKRLVNWDTHLQTSISDDELYTEKVKTNLWSIRYPIEGTDEVVVVATTRPETMLADTAVAYHSSNPKAAMLKGKMVKLPLTGRLIPLIEDDILVDPEFGTGYVKVTPGHDPNDYAVYTRHKGKPSEIAILNLMTSDGKVNAEDDSWAAYTGLTFNAARKKVLEDLAASGFHNPETDVKPHEANVNFSDRSKTAIQPYLSDQWFVRMAELAEPALEVVRNQTIKFFPERHSQQYLSWLGEKRDWPISRQLWWGHRIPVWSLWLHEANGSDALVELIRRYFVEIGLADDIFVVRQTDNSDHILICTRTVKADRALAAWNRFYVESGEKPIDPADYADVVTSQAAWEIAKKIMAGPAADPVTQDPDVLDTWFSSALWPHSTLGWPEQTAELAKYYPGAVLLTGRDIITLWVARMVMTGIYNMDVIPFHHVAINPTILDGKGERMSKSKGNGVDPVEIIDTHGADALRFTLATMATETQDVRLPVKKDAQGRNTSDKFDLGRNFATKLWNAARFVLSQAADPAIQSAIGNRQSAMSLPDRWIISRFNQTVAEANKSLAVYRFDLYAKACYDFFWRDFCDWYLEAIKPAMRDPARKAGTVGVLAAILDGSLRLLHPVIPFITETIWWKLNEVLPHRSAPGLMLTDKPGQEPRLVRAAWPQVGTIDSDADTTFARLQEIVVALRNLRNEHKADVKKPTTITLSAPADLLPELSANQVLIESLAIVTVQQFGTALAAPADAIRISAAGCELFATGLVDPNAEAARIAKKKDDLAKSIASLESRLASPAYTDKAPAHLVEQTRKQLTDAKEELAKLA
jgi:valyl-tRNA synthetase